MMQPDKAWETFSERVNALSLRERALAFGTALVVLFFTWQLLLYDPLLSRSAALRADVQGLTAEVDSLQQQQVLFERQAAQDPAEQRRRRIEERSAELALLDGQLRERTAELVTPAEMVRVLEHLLERDSGLKLLRMETTGAIPAIEFSVVTSADTPGTSPLVYRHGLVVELEGDFFTILSYLRRVESLPWKFIWEGLELDSTDYPRVVARLSLHTLSLSEGWIGV